MNITSFPNFIVKLFYKFKKKEIEIFTFGSLSIVQFFPHWFKDRKVIHEIHEHGSWYRIIFEK